MPFNTIKSVVNEDETKTWTITMAVDTVGNDRTFSIAAKGKVGYFINSGVTFTMDIIAEGSSSTGSESSSGSGSSDENFPSTGESMPIVAAAALALLAGAGIALAKRKNHK